jgi:hypothetical protein
MSVSSLEIRIAAHGETTADFRTAQIAVGQQTQVTGDTSRQGTKVPMLLTEEGRAREGVEEEKGVEAATEDEAVKAVKAVKGVRAVRVVRVAKEVRVAHPATCVGAGLREIVGEVLKIVDFHTTRKQKGERNSVETSREESVNEGRTVGSPTMGVIQQGDKTQH